MTKRGGKGECAECGHLRLHHKDDVCNWGGGKCPCSGMVVLLSPRELEILVLVAGGATNKSAATALGVTQKTIEAHRCNMAIKTDTHSVLELVLLALRSKVVTLGDLPHQGRIEPGKIEST